MFGQPGVELLDSFRERLARHRLAEVGSEAIRSVEVLRGLDEMLLKSSDRLEGGEIELLVIGTMGSLYIGVIFPLPLPDAEELDPEGIQSALLETGDFIQALTPKLLPPVCLSLQDPGGRRRVDGLSQSFSARDGSST